MLVNKTRIYKKLCIMNNQQQFLTKVLKSLLVKLKTLRFKQGKNRSNVEKTVVFNFFHRVFNIGKKKTLQLIFSCKVFPFTEKLYKK